MKQLLVCLPFVLLSVMLVGSQLQAQDAAKPELRTWKDSTGQFSIEAVFIRVSGDQVVLQRKDKTEISIPLAKLSVADQKYVQNIRFEVNSIGMKLTLIPAGEFQMGSPDSDSAAWDREKPQHLVKISKPFYLGVYEVTQQQYEKVMGTRPWQGELYAKEGADYPAVYVSHDDAVEFCRRLSKQEGVEYRLPTEAEWEYAVRAGTTTIYSFGDDASKLGQYAWYVKNAWFRGDQYAHRVGQKLPNRWGLYDMHGNAWEWCQDWYGPYGSEKVVSDPVGATQGVRRVLRGGSFYFHTSVVRSANRNDYARPAYRGSYNGFRAARTYSAAP